MRQQNGIDIRRAERECTVVQRFQRFRSLKQPAIDQELSLRRNKEIAGAGNGAGGAAKLDGDAHGGLPVSGMPTTSRRNARARRSSRRMALVGCGTLLVDRTERMPARPNSVISAGGNSA